MIIVSIIRTDENAVLYSGNGDSLWLTPDAWNRFLQARGAVSIPFDVDVAPSNVTAIDGKEYVTITDARNLS